MAKAAMVKLTRRICDRG